MGTGLATDEGTQHLSTDYSEDALVEQPAIALFSQLGYETANCFYEKVGASGATFGRD